MIPEKLAHYRLGAKLGEGGMGVVYSATDSHLDRPVALKLLDAERVADAERKRRFVQEAKAASALNHPNIVTIHDIGSSDGWDYIAMEYIDGRTLEAALPSGGFALAEVIRIALAIADALTKAHAAGITHRDLKPGNVMLTGDGHVKLLDFGLAKLTERVELGVDDETMAIPTATITSEGAIIGTVAYMSPEQAEGKRVDARSDIFSFGTLLYELLSGKRAFRGDTPVSTLGAVIHRDPQPIRDFVNAIPRDLEKILARCLRKDREQRFQTMADLRVALREFKEDLDAGRTAPEATAPARFARKPAAAVATVLASIAAGAGWWAGTRRIEPPAAPPVLQRVTADGGLSFEPTISPDGKLIAYASDRSGDGNLDLWLRHVAGGEPIRLTKDGADDQEPAFTPDGGSIVFRSSRAGGGLYIMPALGGEARLVVLRAQEPRVSPTGTRVAFFQGLLGANVPAGRSFYSMTLTGGEPTPMAPELAGHAPVWAPDGQRLLARARLRQGAVTGFDWWVLPGDGGKGTRLENTHLFERHVGVPVARATPEAWSADGRWVIFRADRGPSSELWRVAMAGDRLTERFERLTGGTTLEAGASLANTGLLAFSSTTSPANLWMLPIQANQGKATGELRRLTNSAAIDQQARVSLDGRKLVYVSERSGESRVWIRDVATGAETRATAGGPAESWPSLSADGRRVLFHAGRNAVLIDGPGSVPRVVCENCRATTLDLSPDGQFAIVARESARLLQVLDLGTGQTSELARQASGSLLTPRLSSDGRWLALHVSRPTLTGRQVFVLPLRRDRVVPESEWIAITDGSQLDRDVHWSPDGNLLYWQTDRDGFRCVMAQGLDPATKKPIGAPFYVQHFHEPGRSALFFSNSNASMPAVGPGQLVIALGERKGNIWMTQLPR